MSDNATEIRLLDCALTLFAEKGYAATSVREIIEVTGVSRPVLYYYCQSKEGLFLRIVETRLGAAYEGLDSVLSTPDTTESRLRTIAKGTFKLCGQDPRIPRLLFQIHQSSGHGVAESRVRELTARRFALVMKVMEEGLAKGELRLGNPAALALAYCCLIDQHVQALVGFPEPETRLSDNLADGLVSLFLYGVGQGERREFHLASPLEGIT